MNARQSAVIRLGILAAKAYVTPEWSAVKWWERAMLRQAWIRESTNVLFRSAALGTPDPPPVD